jgi:uncharacterized protein (UPF0335 family)
MVEPLHNALGGNTADQLRAYVHRLENLEEKIAGLNSDKREVYGEAKEIGFCKKTLRKLLTRRHKGRHEVQEEDDLLELYEAALLSIPQDTIKDPLKD